MKFKLLLLVLVSVCFNLKAQTIPMYVGTYTNGESEGIYKLDFNTRTGALSNLQLAVATQNPSFIAFSPEKNFLYAVGEGETSAVSAFKLKKDGALDFLNTVSSNGKAPCHIFINTSGNKAVVSNYTGGTISLYQINKNGSLEEASQVFDHNTENEKSHAHSAQFFKDDLFVADLGRNAVYQYKLNNNSYELASDAIVKTTGNPGPRHFVLSQNGKHIYVINEHGSSVTSIKRTAKRFKQIDHDSTMSDDYNGENNCADIHLSKDERFLYGSNRGENSIVVFKRNVKTGKLDKIQNMSVHGNWPRNFTLDPTGKFLLAANQISENISVFSIDNATGKLTFLQDLKVPSPVCLLF
ncbi:lactonase family protein [Tamlana sp. 2201CG12-4]|uniref:lactonase family protein n=1 Tax=Tamlana sp. 2201CG12-4 TaxID=3112582 RepID=UPI002DB6F5F9|nr:lactonase family protein [Tamlana sp. 2201CG12-4]MEC3906659.1 lactonase family protein [Tamlana sp. 2201CG12-4]